MKWQCQYKTNVGTVKIVKRQQNFSLKVYTNLKLYYNFLLVFRSVPGSLSPPYAISHLMLFFLFNLRDVH